MAEILVKAEEEALDNYSRNNVNNNNNNVKNVSIKVGFFYPQDCQYYLNFLPLFLILECFNFLDFYIFIIVINQLRFFSCSIAITLNNLYFF